MCGKSLKKYFCSGKNLCKLFDYTVVEYYDGYNLNLDLLFHPIDLKIC